MKIAKFLALFLFLAPLSSLYAQSELKIEILNLRNSKGVVLVYLLDKNEESFKNGKSKITDMKCTIIIKDLPDGEYAVRCFHDENEDEKLNSNLIGMPKEGFGFSNDPLSRFGPPDFEEWLFTVSGDTEIAISTKYLK